MPPRPDPVREFHRLREKYVAAGITRALTANTPSQLVDVIVRQKCYEQPRLSYREVLTDLFIADIELKRLYAEV